MLKFVMDIIKRKTRCQVEFGRKSRSPNAGEGGVSGSHPMRKAVHRSPNKLWRSNFIFNLWFLLSYKHMFLFFAVTGPGKLTVGKLYGGILIYEIWKTTRFSNLEILAKMEQEMATKLEKVRQLTEQLETSGEG
jgi:hypothetical protein